MARAARLALADMRATQKEQMREEMHGGAFHGAGMVGGGGVPSMGLSQFRGGAKRGCGKHCRGCAKCCGGNSCRGCEMCMDDESSSDEEEMHGGAWYSSALNALGLGARGSAAAAAAARLAASRAATTTTLALRPASNLSSLSGIGASRSLASRLGALRPSTALTVRAPGSSAAVPYNPEAAAYRLGTSAPARTMASRLAAMGITPARVAMALAAGVGIAGLASYFGDQSDSGYYDEGVGSGPRGPGGPGGPSVPPIQPPGGPGGPGGPSGPSGLPGMTPEEEDFFLRTGNVPYRYLEGSLGQKKRGGRSMREPERSAPSKSDGRSKRAAIVRKVMSEKGLSLPAASKYVKDNGLY